MHDRKLNTEFGNIIKNTYRPKMLRLRCLILFAICVTYICFNCNDLENLLFIKWVG